MKTRNQIMKVLRFPYESQKTDNSKAMNSHNRSFNLSDLKRNKNKQNPRKKIKQSRPETNYDQERSFQILRPHQLYKKRRRVKNRRGKYEDKMTREQNSTELKNFQTTYDEEFNQPYKNSLFLKDSCISKDKEVQKCINLQNYLVKKIKGKKKEKQKQINFSEKVQKSSNLDKSRQEFSKRRKLKRIETNKGIQKENITPNKKENTEKKPLKPTLKNIKKQLQKQDLQKQVIKKFRNIWENNEKFFRNTIERSLNIQVDPQNDKESELWKQVKLIFKSGVKSEYARKYKEKLHKLVKIKVPKSDTQFIRSGQLNQVKYESKSQVFDFYIISQLILLRKSTRLKKEITQLNIQDMNIDKKVLQILQIFPFNHIQYIQQFDIFYHHIFRISFQTMETKKYIR